MGAPSQRDTVLPVGNDILLGQKVGKDAEKKGEMVQMAIRQSFRRPELEGLEPLCKHTPWWPRPPASLRDTALGGWNVVLTPAAPGVLTLDVLPIDYGIRVA